MCLIFFQSFNDIKKAFDTVDYKMLLNKFNNCDIRGVAFNWFKSYLFNGKQLVNIRNCPNEMGSRCFTGFCVGSQLVFNVVCDCYLMIIFHPLQILRLKF